LTDKRKVILVATEDPRVVQTFVRVLTERAYRLLVEKNKLRSIWRTLDNNVDCLVMDLKPSDEENAAFVNIIKKVRPRLPIVILSSDERFGSARMLAESGVFYRAFKPLRIEEIEQLIEGVDKIIMRNQDYLCASL